MILDKTKNECTSIMEKTLNRCRSYGAEEAAVMVQGGRSGLTRFARNRVIQNVESERRTLGIAVSIGQREAGLTTSVTDDESIDQAVREAIEMAKLYPENPEHISPIKPQQIKTSHCFDQSTAEYSADDKIAALETVCHFTTQQKLLAFGTLTTGWEYTAIANTSGHFCWHPESQADFSLTVRTETGDGSCRENRGFHRIDKLDFQDLTRKCSDWAAWSREAQYIEPGEYKVILTPTAALNYLMWAFFTMDSRKTTEGRSPLTTHFQVSDPIGKHLFSPEISVYSRISSPDYPTAMFGEAFDLDFGGQGVVSSMFSKGIPVEEYPIIEKGVQKHLFSSVFWARKQGLQPKAFPTLIEFSGSDQSLDDIVRRTDHAILVNSFWYIRFVNPNHLLLTGLTRDGVFLVENGKIVKPLRNLRFNESPLVSLTNVEEVGIPELRQAWFNKVLIPPMVISDFSFTSETAAI
ncbi:TldD/PmbA family protein [bacterium]|nr:TldD/PmbA family protein [candidate division CSSED10-310 bacterium]